MTFPVEIWLRGTDAAVTVTLELPRDPAAWTEVDGRALFEAMLRAMDRAKSPEADERPVFLRGISWIVNPYEDGGVVVAIEIGLGAAVAGPFDIAQTELEVLLSRALSASQHPGAASVH